MIIARVIADPATVEMRLDAASAALEGHGIKIDRAEPLEGSAEVLELEIQVGNLATVRAELEEHFAPCDVLISLEPIAVPGVFVSDMDSTMIGQECIDELADYAGIKSQIAAITERAMQGELDFETALRERVGLLAGLGEDAIERCLTERIRPMSGAKTLVETLKAKGCKTVLVTGGFHHFADPIAHHLGFERVVGNRLDVSDGKLTGRLVGDIVGSQTKMGTLIEEVALLGADDRSLATGDGANDIPMLGAADYGFAYHAKPKARDAANGRIDRGDLTSVLSLLGIPRMEWVEG